MSDRHKRKLRVLLIAGIIFAILFIGVAVLRVIRISAGIKKMKEEAAVYEEQAKEQQNTETPVKVAYPEESTPEPGTLQEPGTENTDTPDPERETEPLEDIGENYSKEVTEDDVVFDEETGIQYAKNQLLISCDIGVPKELMQDVCNEIDAEIVGYIEITSDFQIEFKEDKTFEELEAMMIELPEKYDFIRGASFNMVSEIGID
ncbi:MAG: hypothetical protein J6X97_10200 [Lachnospiraceae bacterium]|nr:hypothetical protein [Lachnospiraceae bacterium]